MQKEELAMYLTNMYAGSRTYTFEIKSSASFGVRDLAITEETRSNDGNKIEVTLSVSSEYLLIFAEMVNAAARFVADSKPTDTTSSKDSETRTNERVKAYTIAEKRNEHPEAYAAWTPEEEAELKRLKSEGKSTREISEILQRSKGAIGSRLSKMGLV